MSHKHGLIASMLLIWTQLTFGQTPSFTRADTLRGMWSPERNCYDVTFYHLEVKIDPAQQSITGSNKIAFKVVTDFDKAQIDLFDNMNIEKIVLDGKTNLNFTREYNAVFIAFPKQLIKGKRHAIQVFYNQKTGQDYSYFFNQYFKQANIPALEVFLTKRGDSLTARYKWKAEVQDFKMPIKVMVAENGYQFIYPTTTWQTLPLALARPENFKIAAELFYVDLKLNWTYLDPRLETKP